MPVEGIAALDNAVEETEALRLEEWQLRWLSRLNYAMVSMR